METYNLINEIKQFAQEHKFFHIQHLEKTHVDLFKKIKEFSLEVEIENIAEKAYLIANNLSKPPICPICQEKFCGFECFKQGFGKTCYSEKCVVEQKRIIRERNLQEKYGPEITNVFQLKEVKQKCEETNLKIYGTKRATQNLKIRKHLSEILKEKCVIPKLTEEQRKESQRKVEETNLKRRGVKCSLQDPEVKQKIKETNLRKRGVEYPSQDPKVREKVKEKVLMTRGVENVSQDPKVLEKIHNTMKKNGSYGKSKDEEYIYQQLLTRFSKIERQYMSEVYPFACDFYIVDLDLYIEYQGYWTHGSKFKEKQYNPQNSKHQQILQEWKQKSKEVNFKNKKKNSYIHAINTWTIRDPQKREHALKFNLNWIEFFNLEEFNNWFDKISSQN